MKRLKYDKTVSGTMLIFTVVDGTSYIFRGVDSWELDITNDNHAEELLQHGIFQDVTP